MLEGQQQVQGLIKMRATETQRVNGEPASGGRKYTEGGFGHTVVPGRSSHLRRLR